MMRRCLRSRRVVGLAVVLFTAGPLWAALKSVSPGEARAEVVRLQGVVAGCAGGGACESDVVGEDLRVGDPAQGGYTVHWDWLRATLDKAKTAAPAKRGGMLRDASTALSRMEGELTPGGGAQKQDSFGRARAQANAVLARPEFQPKDQPTWWDRLKDRIAGWLFKLFEGLARAGSAAPWLGPLLEWMLFGGAAAGLLIFVLRQLSRQRLRVRLEGAEPTKTAWDREAMDWAELAEKHAAAEEWRDAVHCLYWAAIVLLESRRAWRHNPTRTPREYVRLLAAGSAQQRGLRSLTRIFERVWYGMGEARAKEYADARTLYEGLAVGSIESRSSDGTSAIAAGGQA